MAFIDEVTLDIEAGDGGRGCVSFRREKYVPYGGPNGGNGGRGGHVYLKASHDKASLLDFKYRPKFQGERGEHGMGKDMDGRSGEDCTILVPPGTLVYDCDSGFLLADLKSEGDEIRVAKGGKGGLGNRTFTTSTNRAPKTATPGEEGEKRRLKLELRLIADVGLVGLPNAGKSSFLQTVSRAKPKVADYPFTTLEPCLGVVAHKGQTWVTADLPGLIEGASQGTGLGFQFLKHVSRNRVLLHLVDASVGVDHIIENIRVIEQELKAYNVELSKLPQKLVFTKVDLLDSEKIEKLKAELETRGFEGYFISNATQAGLGQLLDDIAQEIPDWRKLQATETAIV